MDYRLIPDAVCLVVCLVAVVTDLRDYRIPNWLTFSAIGMGFVLNPLVYGIAHGWLGVKISLTSALAGMVLTALVFGIFGALKFVGMGDVKLMAAVGALLGWPVALWALVYVAVAGGVLGVLYALARGRIAVVLGNLVRVGRRALGGKKDAIELHRIPYALAILAGSAWAICARYFPALRIG